MNRDDLNALVPEGMTLEEFLNSTFTLRDGTVVTWGDATVEQHKEHVAMLLEENAGYGKERRTGKQ